MARKVSPSQFPNKMRQTQQKQRRAINQYNQAVRKYNRELKRYDRQVRAHNTRVRSNRQRLKAEIDRFNRRSSSLTIRYRVYRASVQSMYEAYTTLDANEPRTASPFCSSSSLPMILTSSRR